MAYLVLARKWRPQTFDDLTGQEPLARILKNAVSQNKVAHAYIFSGPRGVGKTTTARILSKALNCIEGPTPEPCGKCESCTSVSDGSSIDVSEIDGASNNGVDNIRDLRERVRYAPSSGKYKVYIIDEAHMLSTSAFNALLKTLEEPPAHVVFVMATTEPKKIPATVLSRCQHLPFRRISGPKIKERLKVITGSEEIKITDSALEMIARTADGSMRDSLTILDQLVSFSEDITSSEVKDLLGITDVDTLSRLSGAVIEGDRKEIVMIISELVNSGTDIKLFTKDLMQFIRNLLISAIVDDTEGIIELSDEELVEIRGLRSKTSEEHIALLLSEFIKAEPSIRSAFYPRIALEIALIRLSLLSHFKSVNEALKLLQVRSPETKNMETTKPAVAIRHSLSLNTQNDNGSEPTADAPKVSAETQAPVTPAAETEKNLSLPDIWNAVIEKIDEANHPLASKLREGTPGYAENTVILTFNGGLAVHAESVKENLPAIKKAILDLSGKKLSIKIETIKEQTVSKKDLKERALQDPVVKDALELFEGRLVDVIPITNKGGQNV